MKLYDVYCPLCGKLNRRLLLEETGGQMECDRCKRIIGICSPADLACQNNTERFVPLVRAAAS